VDIDGFEQCRVAKYNRLLEIAAAAPDLNYGTAG